MAGLCQSPENREAGLVWPVAPVSWDFFRVCRSAKASASGARDGFPGRESSTPQPRPLDLGLASESGDSDFQLSLCIMLSGRQLHENKKCILMPHHLQACEMPTQRGLSVFVCVLGDFLSPKWPTSSQVTGHCEGYMMTCLRRQPLKHCLPHSELYLREYLNFTVA